MFKLSQRKPGIFNSRTFVQKSFHAADESNIKIPKLSQLQQKNSLKKRIDDKPQFAEVQDRLMFGQKRNSKSSKSNSYQINSQRKRAQTEPIEIIDSNGIETLNPEVSLPKISPALHFPKPYLENTKFVDLLVKNKNLLRRGQFDMPLQHQQIRKIKQPRFHLTPTKTNPSVSDRQQAILRSCSLIKKQLQEKRLKESKRQKKLRLIKKTAEKCACQYQSMFEEQEKDPVKLKHTMNRILAINTIKNQLGFKN